MRLSRVYPNVLNYFYQIKLYGMEIHVKVNGVEYSNEVEPRCSLYITCVMCCGLQEHI